MSRLARISTDRSGAAAAEMALVAPLVLLIMFGAAELGNLFYSQHVVAKAVRDGARYAARQPFSSYDMTGCTLSADAVNQVRRLVRSGQLLLAAQPGLVRDWDEADEGATIEVEVACDGSGTYSGVYSMNGNVAATVRVRAAVPYMPLLGSIGFDGAGRTLTAASEAAVTGA